MRAAWAHVRRAANKYQKPQQKHKKVLPIIYTQPARIWFSQFYQTPNLQLQILKLEAEPVEEFPSHITQ